MDWPSWKAAMENEFSALEGASTRSTVARAAGKNVVGSKWVFRIKHKNLTAQLIQNHY